jgi:hypothetical protein
MIINKRFCDWCKNDITNSHYDAALQDNSINERKEFCGMVCLAWWVHIRYGLTKKFVNNVWPVRPQQNTSL